MHNLCWKNCVQLSRMDRCFSQRIPVHQAINWNFLFFLYYFYQCKFERQPDDERIIHILIFFEQY